MIGLLPFDAGGVKETTDWVLPNVAVTPVGAPGVVANRAVTLLVAFMVTMHLLPIVESQPLQEENRELVPAVGVRVTTAFAVIVVLPLDE